MASTKALARTLPPTAPNTASHRATLDGLNKYKFAIYSIAPLDDRSLHQLEASINSSELSTHHSKLAPQPDFKNRSLRDVYDYHIRIRDEDDTIHPLYFIVADRINLPDDGVLVVLLNSSREEDDVVDVGRCGVDMADSWGANIDVGNQDWLDLKEEEAEQWGGDDPYADDEEGGDAGDHDDDGDDMPSIESKKPQIDSSAQEQTTIYGWYSLVQKAVPINSMLEPGWLNQAPGKSRFQMLGNFYSSQDPWSEIRTAHPRQCVVRPHIHRTLILVAKEEDANQDGAMALARLKWDGDTSGVEDASPPLKPEIEVLKSVRASEALREVDGQAGLQGGRAEPE
ncbi:amino acid permease protein [Teratosphaeria destructans]|uniref:Amino acid permease protein n=1 Tax=Teratosphaeria destructans TaxID=418781 RepID=A0A9W7VZJ6_9PEZI|nr:amino acid permease protein [Teratosphaeria destructans]